MKKIILLMLMLLPWFCFAQFDGFGDECASGDVFSGRRCLVFFDESC